MMALQLKNGDAAYYQSAEYCRNYTSPPVSYGGSSHYLARLPGPETMLKPPLSLFSHPQQPFQHMDSLHQLGPPPMAPTQPLGPPPPPVVAPGAGRFPLPPSPLSSPPAPGPDPSQLPQRPPGPALIPAPVSCLIHGPLLGQAAPASEQPQDEGSLLGMEEQEDSLGLGELCKPLYCKLCNVTLNSAQQAQAHYQGKNHSKKLRNFYAGSQQPPAIRLPEVLEGAGQTALSSGSNDSDAGRQALYKGVTRVILATENDYCKLCDASFSSPAVAQAHYQGKNHAKKLRLSEAQQNSINMEGSNEAAPRRNRKDGSEYRLVKNRRSPQLPASMPGPYYNPRPRQRIPRDLAMCVTPSGQFYCSMCNCGAEQETDFRQHLESKQHKAKVSELRYRHEMENLGYS
ncbi:zinc finger matrin-type protein 3 isoform X2 [Siniperca chuatsi]|uniref:zinc finger matrin-type protein 3 isoform X2 n=1 Tax=Siniperca chuatsi TaxID=119488 RepID=UPI001CE1B7F3|nr:zinc finger matrin-type protein 3 isoform X2 [Siniperca chuatsi]